MNTVRRDYPYLADFKCLSIVNEQIVMFLYRGHVTSTLLEKWKGIDEKSDKKLHKNRTCCQKSHVLHTLLCAFFFDSVFPSWFEALIILQEATRKAHPSANQCI